MKCYNCCGYTKEGQMMGNSALRKHMDFFIIMSRFFLFIFALVLLTVNCSVARADDGYVEIVRNDERIYYLHMPSVENREDYVADYLVGWVKTIIRKPEPPIDGKVPHHTMELWAVNKDAKQIQILQGVLYDKDDNVILSDKFPFSRLMWEDCIPNSIGDALWHIIIDTYRDKTQHK